MTEQETPLKETSTRESRREMGKERRKQVPRDSHSGWSPPADRPDPLSLLRAQDSSRLKDLLPIRYGRMVATPFAFLRGSVAVMSADLARTPVSGINTVLCGDAHLSNFGFFATPERNLVFDLNDFDEAYQGPWEWDLKRLAASAVVAGRQIGLKDKQAGKVAVRATKVYREAMALFSGMSIMDTWYFQVKAHEVLAEMKKHYGDEYTATEKAAEKASSRTEEATVEKITEVVDGRRRFISDPPLLVRLNDLLAEKHADHLPERSVIESAWSEYLTSLPEERRLLLNRFRITDVALRVVGVGSVGTRCGIALLEGDGGEDAIILQIKEALQSVLEAYLPKHDYASPSYRVVLSQRMLQAASDLLLGWNEGTLGNRYYYWRQLKDMKGSVKIEKLKEQGLLEYISICGECLARAHARTGDPSAISGYLGTGDTFDVAIGDFALAYADQAERDHQLLLEAVKAGEIKVTAGI